MGIVWASASKLQANIRNSRYKSGDWPLHVSCLLDDLGFEDWWTCNSAYVTLLTITAQSLRLSTRGHYLEIVSNGSHRKSKVCCLCYQSSCSIKCALDLD